MPPPLPLDPQFPLPELCLGDTISLGIDLLGPNLLTSWSPGGATTTSIDVFEGGVFSATVTNSITGCDTVADLTVVEKLNPGDQ